MAAQIVLNQLQQIHPLQEEPFCDKHFAKIALAASAVALALLGPFDLFLGAVAGFALHYFFEPTVKADEKLVTIPNAAFAIVGAVAALLRFTPAGIMGGFLFHAVPFLGSTAVGNTLYRMTKLRV